jgi:hypothetical protein
MIPIWLNLVLTLLVAIGVSLTTCFLVLRYKQKLEPVPSIMREQKSEPVFEDKETFEVYSTPSKGDAYVVRSKEFIDEEKG